LRNEAVRRTVQQERTSVVRIAERRLTWSEPVSRMGSERLPANILHHSVNERREQWRQPKKGMDNVKEDMETEISFPTTGPSYKTESSGDVW